MKDVNEREVLYLRLSAQIVEKVKQVAKLEGKSVNRFMEDYLTQLVLLHGLKVKQTYPIKQVADQFQVSTRTVKKWLRENPEIPVINRGVPGMRLSEAALNMLRAKVTT